MPLWTKGDLSLEADGGHVQLGHRSAPHLHFGARAVLGGAGRVPLIRCLQNTPFTLERLMQFAAVGAFYFRRALACAFAAAAVALSRA